MSEHRVDVILLAARKEHPLETLLTERGFGVVRAPSGTLAVDWSRDIRPDMIVLEPTLSDMSGIEACHQIRANPALGRTIPILLLLDGPPSPTDWVSALRSGIWDFLRHPSNPADVLLTIETYLQTKRNIDSTHAEVAFDSRTGLYNRVGLARRSRELAALMSRLHGPLACVVLALDFEPLDAASTARAIVRDARSSDVVGQLSATEFGLLAPGTDREGALDMTRRLGQVLRASVREAGASPESSSITAGYEAVPNFKYAPMDPVQLLARASAAARSGTPVSESPWVRHFTGDASTNSLSGHPVGAGAAPSISFGRSHQ